MWRATSSTKYWRDGGLAFHGQGRAGVTEAGGGATDLLTKCEASESGASIQLRIAGNLRPIQPLGGGVFGEGLFVLDQNGPHNAGIVGTAVVQDEIGNDVDFLMRVSQSEQ